MRLQNQGRRKRKTRGRTEAVRQALATKWRPAFKEKTVQKKMNVVFKDKSITKIRISLPLALTMKTTHTCYGDVHEERSGLRDYVLPVYEWERIEKRLDNLHRKTIRMKTLQGIAR